MARGSDNIDVYLEIGKKRTIAGALDWPGWCRGGRDEDSALQALFDYGPRYARVLRNRRLGFHTPTALSALVVVERLEGNATTDFGAPDIAPSVDMRPLDDADLQGFQRILRACWQAFDTAMEAAQGKELRKGPRGGGREVAEIARHVRDVERSYLRRLAWKLEKEEEGNASEQLQQIHQAVLDALAAGQRGELPERGPRGGVLWKPRYFVRRLAWHVLDHVWEIEDRASSVG
jgi:hypothetical protein